jgi:ATP synthase F1 delta subunit
MITGNFHIKVGTGLLRSALTQKVEDKVAADLDGLTNLMKDKNFKVLLQSVSYLPEAAAQKVLQSTFHGKVNDLTLKLLFALSQQKALKYLSKIATVFRKNYNDAKGIKEITIRTAREFSPQEQLSFVQKLQAKKKHTITVKFEVDPALVAGAQVYENSYLTDYSVKNYLETLQKHLTSQTL